jgi:hypothetical protein
MPSNSSSRKTSRQPNAKFSSESSRKAGCQNPDELPSAARVIDEALRILGPHGEQWIKGSEDDTKGNYCIMGAIDLAREKLNVRNADALRFVRDAIRKEEGRSHAFIARFNDGDLTTFVNVRRILLLAKCDAINEARGKSRLRANIKHEHWKFLGLT